MFSHGRLLNCSVKLSEFDPKKIRLFVISILL